MPTARDDHLKTKMLRLGMVQPIFCIRHCRKAKKKKKKNIYIYIYIYVCVCVSGFPTLPRFLPDPKHFIVNREQNVVKFAGKWGRMY